MNNLNWNEFVNAISDYVGVDAGEIERDTDIYDDLYLDSLGLFGLGSHITDTFRLNIPLSAVASISKTGEIFDLLNEQGVPFEE